MEKIIPIVLCAGFGTRLRPLSSFIPKTVVPVDGWPVAYHSIRALLQKGADVVHCNTHYLPEVVEQELRAALQRDGYTQERIRFWHEPEILETGGGIARIVQALNAESPEELDDHGVLVIAGDVYAQAPLDQMISRWNSRPVNAAVLLTTRALQSPRPDVTWVDSAANQVVGFGTDIAVATPCQQSRLFTTHQIISARLIIEAQVIRESSRDLFFRAALRRGLSILNVDYPDEAFWWDIGDYSSLAKCVSSRRLGTTSLPKRCLIVLSQADLNKNIAGRSVPACVKSSGDFFRGFSYPTKAPSLSSSPHSSGFFLAEFSPNLDSPVSPLAADPTLPGGASFKGATRCLQVHCAVAPCPDLSPLLTQDPGNPSLFFSLAGTGLPEPLPFLLPLELLTSSEPLEPCEPLAPLYRSSRTFFLFH